MGGGGRMNKGRGMRLEISCEGRGMKEVRGSGNRYICDILRTNHFLIDVKLQSFI
jgi:hypothetical protein